LGLILGRSDYERNGIAKFHDVVHKDFDVVGAGNLEFDLAEKRHVRRIESGILEAELHLAFSQNGCLVGRDQSHSFGEIANACGPTIEETEPECDDRDLRDSNKVHHSDEEKIAGDFLADFFAEERALEIRENSGGVHS
jgi:hypothetical protein